MGSRLRENPSRFIECWCEIVAPQGSDHPPWIFQKFPRTYDEQEVLKSVPHFTFPCPFEKSAVQHFSFVLTNLESKFLYGFCRHAPDVDTALVILSHLPWHELFYKVLNHCSNLQTSKNAGDLWSFLQCIYQASVPVPGTKLSLSYDDKFFVAECPNHISLPSIPENRNLSEYYSAVDVTNMMMIFASMLNERRIVVTSEKLSRLSACVQAANGLLFPMTWQHIFIPVLPEHLIDYLSAPMPFLIGVPWYIMQKVRLEELGDAVVLNADTNSVSSPFSDLQNFPEEVVTTLRKSLSPPNNLLGDGVARAFMRALVHLVGNYREALQFREEDRRITFNQEKFVAQRPPHFQPFMEKMLELQIFNQFIEERLDLLNSGLHTSDEFELEASVYGDKTSSKVKQILSNVKSGSGAIMKNVRSKTNPAMKSAVKSMTKSSRNVREKSRTTYKEFRGMLKDRQKSTESSTSTYYVNGVKPRSAPSSPTQSSQRSFKSFSVVHEGYSARTTYKKVSQMNSCALSGVSSASTGSRTSQNGTSPTSSGDSEKTPSPQDIDLIGEMEDVLKTQLLFSTTPSLQETASTISIDSSVISSETGGSSSLFNVDFPSSEPLQETRTVDPLTNGDREMMVPVGSKPLSASLASLPLLDLSLDIPLPPPIFSPHPTSSASAPAQRGHRATASLRHPSFRCPKILPPETFGSLPSSLEAAPTVSAPPPPPSSSSSSSAPPSGRFGDGAPATADGFVGPTCRPKAHTLPVHGERQVGGGSVPPVPRPRKKQATPPFPKYDVSPSFSASLARFSASKGDFSSSYYFSSLCKASSGSSDSVLDFEASDTPLEEAFSPPNPPCIEDAPSDSPLSPPDVLGGPSWDAMTMSLPPGIASLSDLLLPPTRPSLPPTRPSPPPARPSPTLARPSPPPTLPVLSPPPRSRRRRKKATSPAQENGAAQDLLFLNSPKDEVEFDPLLVKEIPRPPVPSRQQKTTPPTGDRGSRSIILPIDPPKKLNPDRFLPFNSLQQQNTVSNRVSTSGVQNPLYNPHQLPFEQGRGPFPPTKPPPILPNNNNNNAAAIFAASLLSGSSEDGGKALVGSRISNVSHHSQFEGAPVVPPRQNQGALTERDLLGDFSSDFKKLSVSSAKVAAPTLGDKSTT